MKSLFIPLLITLNVSSFLWCSSSCAAEYPLFDGEIIPISPRTAPLQLFEGVLGEDDDEDEDHYVSQVIQETEADIISRESGLYARDLEDEVDVYEKAMALWKQLLLRYLLN